MALELSSATFKITQNRAKEIVEGKEFYYFESQAQAHFYVPKVYTVVLFARWEFLKITLVLILPLLHINKCKLSL